ncbi:MAG: tetratricopeptide repeat protein [Planctomycetota bacterium]|jgi:tetratricopeptide (TPR) repeat protein|nr:tetratricopeptide repeat protein [Planctomycetota bacterium]
MDWNRPALMLVVLFSLIGCSSSEEELNLESQKQDYFERATDYYNMGRYTQAYQQARRGLEIEPENGGLNLIAGRSLLLHRDITEVSHALLYLEIAQKELQNHKADQAMAEWHFRYGSMLLQVSETEKRKYTDYPMDDPEFQAKKMAEAEERGVKAMNHFLSADELLDSVLLRSNDNLNALEMSGQVNALLGNDVEALKPLVASLRLLEESRAYNNRLLATEERLSIEQEDFIRRVLKSDMQREVAVHSLIAGIHKRAGAYMAEEHEYTTILGLSPDSIWALHSRALCRYERGRLSEAAADMRDFVAATEMDFDSDQVRQALNIISEYDALQSKAD